MTISLVVRLQPGITQRLQDTDPGKEVHLLSAIEGCRIFSHRLRFHSAWETVTTSFISHGFPEKVAGGAARKTGHAGPGGKGWPWSQDLWAALSVARESAEGSMPCSEGRCQPCPLPEGQPLGCGARTVSPRWVLAKSWPRSGAGRVGRASLQHTVGSHIHAQGRELSNQSLESGFLVFVFISSFQSGLQLAKLFLCIVVSYGSERVVASQMTKGWAPLATM